ncbi:hypothetical protein FHR24_001448 [Wenyingzhuangia heitensis]|uniref:Secretion system C-terminal sorting domain-containing protein n=1 Tax=Wenyingzhuangia heitensis TaxID=1487859 RepID=A0ABX0U9H6_9FLAO|nr:T9SS type A sorting domain-containing protein [Wenyingzhuangia heitensis]NIJ45009.1 hypothetical protein [Wenyingzhuangia heitensis]
MKTNFLIIKLLIAVLFCTNAIEAQKANVDFPRNRRYDEVSWLISHNANNNRKDGPGGFCLGGANQELSMQEQFNYGVRKFMVDIHLVNGNIKLKHGSPNMCMMDGKNFNNLLESLLRNNPTEIITLHIQNGPNLGLQNFNQLFLSNNNGYKNLSSYIYDENNTINNLYSYGVMGVTDPKKQYPFIGEMQETNKRLMIFVEANIPSSNGNHSKFRKEFNYTVQNNYSATQVSHLWESNKFTKHRGVEEMGILTINHFAIDNPFGVGDKNKSKEANTRIYEKAMQSWLKFGKRPSVAVDFSNLVDSGSSNGMVQMRNVNKHNEIRGVFKYNGQPVTGVKGSLCDQVSQGCSHKIGARGSGAYSSLFVDSNWNGMWSFPVPQNNNIYASGKRYLRISHNKYHIAPKYIDLHSYRGENKRTYPIKFTAQLHGAIINNLKTLEDEFKETESKQAIKIIANPVVNQKLEVAISSDFDNVTITVRNISGIEVLVSKGLKGGTNHSIDVSMLNKGIYIVSIQGFDWFDTSKKISIQ